MSCGACSADSEAVLLTFRRSIITFGTVSFGMPAEGSFFLEIPVVDPATDELRHQLPDDAQLRYPGHTPPVALPHNLRFYFLRPEVSDRELIETHPFFRDSLIGESWEEVAYKPYRFRDYVLQGAIERPGIEGQLRVPLVDIGPGDQLAERVAYPPGVFAGDEVPTFEISTLLPIPAAAEQARKTLRAQLDQISEAIRGANDLSDEDRARLQEAVRECDRLATQTPVRHRQISAILRSARDFAVKIGQGLIVKALWEGLVWLWQNWARLPW